jgi:NAD(P)-dependent dehydrogenase (short-subunit alcohol dehydrogenase family)
MSDLLGKTMLITGANTGIGRATALALGARGATLFLAGRSAEKTRPVVDEINAGAGRATFLPLDLGDLDSVKACAEAFLSDPDRPLHVLINNAGLAGSTGVTAQGFEKTFGVNHLGHFLLTELLLDRLKASAPARIVNVASMAHYKSPPLDLEVLQQSAKTHQVMTRYRVSKLCNVLHAKDLAGRLAGSGVTTYSLHPGVVASDVWRNVPRPLQWVAKPFMISNEQGAATSLYCAASPACADQSGLYYDEEQEKTPSAQAQDLALAERLRARSAAWVVGWLPT